MEIGVAEDRCVEDGLVGGAGTCAIGCIGREGFGATKEVAEDGGRRERALGVADFRASLCGQARSLEDFEDDGDVRGGSRGVGGGGFSDEDFDWFMEDAFPKPFLAG